MPINGVNNQSSPQVTGTTRNLASAYSQSETVNPELPPQIKQREDTVEISEQARELIENKSSESFGRVQSQINAGFYNRQDVLRQTASKLAQSIRDTKPI
ncbi:MAG: hypothetical protein ACK5C0_11170 [Candidatus Kapaibacterium sp.]|jgi:hypothetical protein|nr:hypothetical protein [Candidatus Kapabacteria bacterium]